MKITQDTLRKIIREELQSALNEGDVLPRAALFRFIRDEGLIMHDVNREEFFQWLQQRGFTTAEAVAENRGLIAGWLKKERAAWVKKNRP